MEATKRCRVIVLTLWLAACGGAPPPHQAASRDATPQSILPPLPPVLSTPPNIAINVQIDNTARGFRVHNKDDFSWTDCTFVINAKTGKGGYSVKIGSVKPKKSIYLVPGQFSNDDGERFNIFTHKPSNLDITCDTPNGWGSAHLHSVEDDQSDN